MIFIFKYCGIMKSNLRSKHCAPVRKKVEIMSAKGTFRSKVAIVDKSLQNFSHVHSDILRSNATLKERAAINMSAWTGGVFDPGKKYRK